MPSASDAIDVARLTAARATPDALLAALFEQQKSLAESRAENDRQAALVEKKSEVISHQKARIAVLEEQLRLLRHRRFGASSERQHALQQDLLFDEAEQLADGEPDPQDPQGDHPEKETAEETAGADASAGDEAERSKRAPRGAKRALSPDLPREQVRWALTESERAEAIDTFFVVVKEELDITPARVQVIEHLVERAVYLDAEGERTVRSAARPSHPIGKAIASVNLLAWLIVAKYCDGLPLYRLEKVLARYGGEITRTTMANWLIRLHAALEPLLVRFEAVQLGADYLQGDETRMQVLKEPGMAATGSKWIWVMRGGPPGKTVVTFNYDRTRGGAVAERLLQGFAGRFFQSDGYSGYDGPCAAKALVHLGCWDHARRKVVEAIRAQPKGTGQAKPSVAMVMLSHIDGLYRLERQWAELDDDERFEQRQKQAVAKLEKLRAWLEQKQPKVAPDTLTRRAINYTLNRWDHLVRYTEHGQLKISNALAENAIRPFAVGRKAWLFADTPAGAQASAGYFSLIETAKANGVEPYAYMQKVIANIAQADTDEALEALLPWNVS